MTSRSMTMHTTTCTFLSLLLSALFIPACVPTGSDPDDGTASSTGAATTSDPTEGATTGAPAQCEPFEPQVIDV